jgi:hypothetical protein
MRSGGTSWVGGVLVIALACGCAGSDKGKRQGDAVEEMGGEASEANAQKARALIEKAVAALRDGKLEEARKHLAAADPLADDLKRNEIIEVRASIDSAEADKYVPGIVEAAEAGKCTEALDTAVEVIDGKKGGKIPEFVIERSSKHLLKCVLDKAAADLGAGRALADDPRVEKSLTKAALEDLHAKVAELTVAAVQSQFDEPIKGRRWAEAKQKLEELAQKKEIGDRERARIVEMIRKGVSAEIAEKVKAGLDKKTGSKSSLDEVDALVTTAGWKAGAEGAEAVPVDVEKGRRTLGLWVVCQNLKCNLTEPKAVFAYGNLQLKPADDNQGETVDKIQHATKVWRIAEGGGFALLAKRDPGKLEGIGPRVDVAIGWVPTEGLKDEDTTEWLPPGDSIKGTRVWGPLREGQPWELGIVVNVKDANVGVERFSDRSIITVPRAQVRFGTVTKGTKVLAICEGKSGKEAVIDEATFRKVGDPVVKVSCLDAAGKPGTPKEQLIGGLRTKPEWLPARK